jgi:4-amino-4-deoxy-L-arabinose transferase
MGAAIDRRADRSDRRADRSDRRADRSAPSDAASTTRGRFGIALLLIFALVYVLPLGVRPLASPDEVRYGAISHEMISSGDWVSPHFNGVRYFEKPPLGLWLNSVSMKLLGENAFALRLPAALATGLTALIVFVLARRFASRSAAGVAAGIYLTTFLVLGLGTFAILDAFLALFLTAALAAFYFAVEADGPDPAGGARVRVLYLALCGAACGAAFLVKGFLALAIPVVVAAPFLAARRRWRTLFASPWIPIAAAALVVLPWAVLIQLSEPDFWRYFFWVEHIQRFAADDAQHAQPFWYYFAWLPLAGWPWILLLPVALLGLRGDTTGKRSAATGASERSGAPDASERTARRVSARIGAPRASTRFLGYLAAWAVLPFLFLSLARGKLPTYLLPCFAPLAILLAVGLERYLAAGKAVALRAASLVIAAVMALVLAALVAAQAGVFGEIPFAAAELPKLLGFAALIAVGIAFALYAAFGRSGLGRLAALAGAGAALFLPLEVMLPKAVLDNVSPVRAVAHYAAPVAGPDTVLVSDAPLFGTVAWALERNDIYVMSPGEIDYGLSYPEARHRLLDAAALGRLIGQSAGRRAILIVCESSTEREIVPVLPKTAQRSQHGKVILWRIPAA